MNERDGLQEDAWHELFRPPEIMATSDKDNGRQNCVEMAMSDRYLL